ncbi:MAG: hypothetical protein IKO19_08190 [Candidatus Riflebacteria bacterium]|nr:hypothetical protein [Candidatus Riflebacteria bacterium]
MNKKITYILLVFMLVFSTNSYAEELWELTQPGNANIGQSVFVNQERLGLYIPKSFEGRRVNEDRTNFGFEIKNTFRFKHSDSEVNLKGMVNKMNFEYKTDIIDVQIFRSKNMKPGASACMDCHGSSIPRTLATIGYGQTKIDAYRYVGNDINKSESRFFRANVDHWVQRNLMLKGEVRLGKVEQGALSLDAKSISLGIGGTAFHRLTWSGDWILSKVDNFKARNSLIGKVTYKIIGGLKFKFEAGAFLDGYTQFGTTLSEMGMATAEPVNRYADWLPNFFKRLKNDAFGYYNACVEYEHRF